MRQAAPALFDPYAGLRDLEARHTEAARALAALEAAHDALLSEREANAARFRELASRTLAELEAAQEALRREREASARARQELDALRRHPAP